jgi:hypothetical protein
MEVFCLVNQQSFKYEICWLSRRINSQLTRILLNLNWSAGMIFVSAELLSEIIFVHADLLSVYVKISFDLFNMK